MTTLDTGSAWQQTIDLLSAASEPVSFTADLEGSRICKPVPVTRSASEAANRRRATVRSWDAQGITLIRRHDSDCITVCWSDATYGRYSDQLWRVCTARRSSVCALTGEKIRRGDAVFRPSPNRRHRPANADAMILASKIENLSNGALAARLDEALAA
ncbi:MAG: DUF3331 domain-containing protein [Paraburkholderia sp.]|uniref:DUF3331 domain-containing protein n=1 Tax=Paraburkholderia sp. TaxID=1926495 RepID=UPI001212863A|nr:DUF3331 domain-containing protein [Paraburkholderia sp.]TAM02021.1 MAG: DUF3331 domain-containing protein [Paraburkholderia sp.]TAM32088.1 MAG: DUF3331 domain-containing protein [Paraburkholderia sp.]